MVSRHGRTPVRIRTWRLGLGDGQEQPHTEEFEDANTDLREDRISSVSAVSDGGSFEARKGNDNNVDDEEQTDDAEDPKLGAKELAVVPRAVVPPTSPYTTENQNILRSMCHTVWIWRIFPEVMKFRKLRLPNQKLTMDFIPESLRQLLPRMLEGVNPKQCNLPQRYFGGGHCAAEIWEPSPCLREPNCPLSHAPPTSQACELFLRLGELSQKFVMNMVKYFLMKYPKWRSGQGPALSTFVVGQRTTAIPWRALIIAEYYVEKDLVQNGPLAELFYHFDVRNARQRDQNLGRLQEPRLQTYLQNCEPDGPTKLSMPVGSPKHDPSDAQESNTDPNINLRTNRYYKIHSCFSTTSLRLTLSPRCVSSSLLQNTVPK